MKMKLIAYSEKTCRRLQVTSLILLFITVLIVTAISYELFPSPAYATDGPSDGIVSTQTGPVTPKTVFGAITSATTTTIVPAVAGKSIVVWCSKIVANGTVKATLQSGPSTAIDSPWPLTNNTGMFACKDVGRTPLYRTYPGQALTILTDTTGELDYWFKYTEE